MKNKFTKILVNCAAAAIMSSSALVVSAEEITLRLHGFLPSAAMVPKVILKPWAERIEKASKGRIKIEHFDGMALGGRPPELMDQAIDGVVDISMAIVGYTPGRFPKSEVFELPFMMTQPGATANAFWEMIETDLQNTEYRNVKVLAAWLHGPGAIHSKKPVRSLEDMVGQKLRGPTRVINDLLKELGSVPVGIPLPATPEALSKGVIDGTVISWEVIPSLRLAELVDYHTDFSGTEALYSTEIILVMNQNKYEELPADLRDIIDAESGAKLSVLAAETMAKYDEKGRESARKAGNEITLLDEAEVSRWKLASQPVYDRWFEYTADKGIDGKAVVETAKKLIQKYEK